MILRIGTVGKVLPQRIRDPVHGIISFGDSGDCHRDKTDQIAWDLINTPELQRLRRIRQLGFSDLVYPGATHSRFAHSIGVYQTARRLADIIARKQPKSDRERERVALLAALLHDVGHGPFSHAFEAVAEKQHEEWSAEIILDETCINKVLRKEGGEELPEQIAKILKAEYPADIYATIVSSQFDADRIDYIQRDRMAAGIESGHVDCEWLFDCLEVGKVTIGDGYESKCLYLGPKGISVAEEYLEARYRLYQKVYIHKTTRSAEMMLKELLRLVKAEKRDKNIVNNDPFVSYLNSDTPTIGNYLLLDDAAVWSTLTSYMKGSENQNISALAERLRNRDLYKCVDISCPDSHENAYIRVKRKLKDLQTDGFPVLIDEPTITPYKWYDFESSSALHKVLVKTSIESSEPQDISTVSDIIEALQKDEHIRRAYVPKIKDVETVQEIVKEVRK